jgi:hypothetical protein
MTVSNEINRYEYVGNGSAVAFPFANKFFANSDLVVELVTTATGVSDPQVLDSDYAVTGAGVDAGGTVTMSVAPTALETLVIYRDPALTQLTDYVENDDFPAAAHENALDKAMLAIQRNRDLLDRSVKQSDDSISTADFSMPDPVANNVLGWNIAGDALENKDFTLLGTTDVLTSTNTPDTGVKRDANGDFAAGEITAEDQFTGDLVGDVKGNVNSSNGTGVLNPGTDGSDVVLNATGITGTAIKDEDDMSSDSASHLATQQSIKAYVDSFDNIVQRVSTTSTSAATGTTVMPVDDSIPQNTEGIEWMTIAITPTNSNNKLVIKSVAHQSHTTTDAFRILALFKDTDPDALAVGVSNTYREAASMAQTELRHEMVAGTTSEITFKIRGGCPSAGTMTFNGISGTRRFGGTLASYITVEEITV